jgi:serine/threonine protein kinase/tetratricopeptide (TPR) repeat protein
MTDPKTDLRSIFCEALDRPDPEELAKYLDAACHGDSHLRARVEALLDAHCQAREFLGGPADPLTVDVLSCTERTNTVIGPYRLLQQIGEGGMGTVYMAEQTQPVQRKVAIKVIKPGMDSRQVIARFEAERQALAMMDHVNIARVLDAGATESGRPYFVMELVHGVPITKYCDDNHLAPHQRLELFIPVCHAIQHAHHKGIIHRDIKPSNVMITLYDGRPVPKVIDFGVAKATEQRLTERTLFTQYGTMVGTLEYTSPEQAEMSGLGVDTRSDIYSLGVLLYELLTGSTPLSHKRLKEAAFGEVLRMIREEEPPRPSTRLSESGAALASISAQRQMEPAKLTKLIRGELDWIVMKTLEKDRNRRYETANGLARDIEHYLHDEPVQACPPSAVYRFRKFARRNKAALATAILVAAVLLVGIVGTSWEAIRAMRAETSAKGETNRANREADRANDEAATAKLNLIEAERQTTRAEQSVAEVERQQTLAEASFRQARQVVAELFAEVINEGSLDEPRLRPFRMKLLESLLEYDRGFVQQRGDDPAMQAELAASQLRVAAIGSRAGSNAEALAASQKAVEIRRKMIQLNPDDRQLSADLANTLNDVGLMYHDLGDLAASRRSYEESVAMWESLVPKTSQVPANREGLARAYNNLGFLLREDLGQPNEAWPFYEKSLEIRKQLAEQHAESAVMQYNLARAYSAIGTFKLANGPFNEATDSLTSAQRIFEDLARRNPSVLTYQSSLAHTYNTLGDVHRSERGPNWDREALAWYQKSKEMQERLVSANPHVSLLHRELANTDMNIGDVKRKVGDRDGRLEDWNEAVRSYRVAIGTFENEIGAGSDAVELLASLAASYQRMGLCLAQVGQQQEAAAACRVAVQHYRAAFERSPKNGFRQELFSTALRLAGIERELGRPAESAAAALEARALGPSPTQLYFVARELSLAAAAIGSDKPLADEARTARDHYLEQSSDVLRDAIAAFTKAVELNPNDLVACNYLSWLYTIGPEALRNAEKALPLAHKAVELKPQIIGYQKNLGMAYYRIGQYDEALRILVPIAEARADEVGAHALFFLSMTYQHLGEADKAHACYHKVIEWWEGQRRPPEHLPEMWAMQAETEALLGIVPSPPTGTELPPTKREKDEQPPATGAEPGAG